MVRQMVMMRMRMIMLLRMMTRVNPRPTNDVGFNPPSKPLLHRPLQGFISSQGSALLGDTRLKILQRAKTPFSALQRHDSINVIVAS
eukprot:8926751-Pyramimonas_sp.AAC.1